MINIDSEKHRTIFGVSGEKLMRGDYGMFKAGAYGILRSFEIVLQKEILTKVSR